MIEVELFGAELAPDGPARAEVQRLCVLTTRAVGVDDGHLAIEYVDADRIAALNSEHRGKPEPTDVLSFPIDGPEAVPAPPPAGNDDGERGDDDGRDDDDGGGGGNGCHPNAGPRELGDVLICPEHTADLREAIVHGVLHLVGMDHETDNGEMLALQAQLLDREAT